jgi:hypothetical protein
MLDAKFESLYPELTVGEWVPAWQAALRRAERVWLQEGAEALIFDRLLPDQHFHFRGGIPRLANWHVIPERLSDPSPAEAGNLER